MPEEQRRSGQKSTTTDLHEQQHNNIICWTELMNYINAVNHQLNSRDSGD